MLVAGQNGLPAIPRCNHVHVIRRRISLRGVRVRNRSQQSETRWRNGDLFQNFPDQGSGERLALFLMASRKTPEARIGAAMGTATGQQDITVSYKQCVDDVSHGIYPPGLASQTSPLQPFIA